jgi:crotonobetaine/carnitine-CoA ligase
MPHGFALFMGETISHLGQYTEQDRLLCALPLYGGNARYFSAAAALISGAQLVLLPSFCAETFWDSVHHYGCTQFTYHGWMLSTLLAAPSSSRDSDNPMRAMLGGGAPPDRVEEFESRFGVRILESYGTRDIGLPLCNGLDERKVGSCGKLVPGYDAILVDDRGNEVGPDVPGELYVRPHARNAMMLEFYGMPEATVQCWRDLWFHTGDYLTRDVQGWFYFVDRKSDALPYNDTVVPCANIERVVNLLPAVAECAAFSVLSPSGRTEIMICAVRKRDCTLSPEQLRAHLGQHLPKADAPRYLRFLDALPRIIGSRPGYPGAVRKFLLREQGVTVDTLDLAKG